MATTNQNKLIATMGTPTIASTIGPTDIHLNASGAPVPHLNSVPTSRSTSGTTSPQTTIAGSRIVLQGQTNIGPMSNSPWPGEVGQTSGVTGMEANVKKGSPNVKAEKLAVARFLDPTFQNKKNCSGQITVSDAALAAQMLEQQKALRCKIVSLTATCGHGRAAAKDRLEVLLGDTVTLTATRIDALQFKADGSSAGAAAVCGKAPKHSHFVVTRALKNVNWGPLNNKQQTYTGKDTLTLGEEWLGKPPEKPAEPSEAGGTTKNKVEVELSSPVKKVEAGRSADGTRASDVEISRHPGNPPVSTEHMLANFHRQNRSSQRKAPLNANGLTEPQQAAIERNRIAEQKYRHDLKRHEQDKGLKARMERAEQKRTRDHYIEATIWTLVEVVKSGPHRVIVEAMSCAGNKKVDVYVYPRGRYVIDVYQFVQPIVAAMNTIKNTVDIFQKFFRAAGGGLKIEFSFCSGPYGIVAWEWKEVAGELRVAPAFEIDFGFQKLLELKAEFRVPLLSFVGPLGGFAAWLLEKVNVRGDIGAFCAASLGLSLSGTMFDWKFAPGAVSAPLVFEFGLFAELSAGDSFTLKIEVKVEWAPKFAEKLTMRNGNFAGLVVKAGKVELKIEFTATADIFGLRGGRNFGLTVGEFSYGEQTINCLPGIPAAQKSA